MASQFFWAHGKFCAAHPWEVIVATLTLTACMLTMDHQQPHASPSKSPLRECAGCLQEAGRNAVDLIVMTLIRCLAVLYTYYQFRNLHGLGSKYILGIAGLFTVFSSFVFTSTVLGVLRIDVSDLKDALFFFLLLIDLSKAAMLAQFAVSASNQEEVERNIARGLSLLGPTITLDTTVEALVISVGTLSGVQRLEMLSCFACLSILVNYVVFMTFYPACLSLTLELSRTSALSRTLFFGEKKPNPVVQRVKLIMSAGLMLVHVHRWWAFKGDDDNYPLKEFVSKNLTEDSDIMKWVTFNTDHIVILILLLTLAVKYIFFENKEEVQQQLLLTDPVASSKNNQLNTSLIAKVQVNVPCFKNRTAFLLGNTEAFKLCDKAVQTETTRASPPAIDDTTNKNPCRSLEDCLAAFKSSLGADNLSDEEVILLVGNKTIASYDIEKAVNNPERGVRIRRKLLGESALLDLPYKNYDYTKVMGACCENVIGYTPVPVGIAGPLLLDGQMLHVPMATTEGCLVASTNRGCRALLQCGVKSSLVADGMTRGPVVRFSSASRASAAMLWMDQPENFNAMKTSFDSTSRYARLTRLHSRIAGRHLFIRFVAKTGDAMGMNMLSKGTESSLTTLRNHFPDMEILSLSGNFCADKKPAAVNWIEGRGKSVVCEAVVPESVVSSILKTSVLHLVDVNISKNLIGSAMAGSIGGYNAHAANVVTAIYIATGQDPAQNVVSSNCITLMEPWGQDLYISCTMPSIEVGTIGGGTVLPAQAACLEMLGVRGPNEENPGENSSKLARIVCGVVLAGELSLMAALASGDLVKSHLRHNRSSKREV